MRANEFIIETVTSGKKAGKLRPSYKHANPGAITSPDLDKYYDMYRASMLMGKAPTKLDDVNPTSWINDNIYLGYYTEAEKDKIIAAFKALGVKKKDLIPAGSKEIPGVNCSSPMKGFKGYPR